MGMHKGKPGGRYSETKKGNGRKRDYQRTGWPEDAPTQRVDWKATRKEETAKQEARLTQVFPDGFARGDVAIVHLPQAIGGEHQISALIFRG